MTLLYRIRTHFVGRVATLALATAFSAILSVALLPLATRVLEASDYGTYALLMSIVTLVSTAMDGGASLLFPARYGPAFTLERGRIFVSVAVIAGIGASTVALLLTSVWIWQHRAFPNQVIPFLTIAITAIIIPMRAVTSISVTVFSVTGRSGAIAAQMASQAVLVFLGTLVALFGFSMGGVSLFIGAACGQFAALCVCLLVLWHHNELSTPSRRWFRGAMTSAPATGVSGFMDGARGFGENAMLAGASGLHAAGILNHARLYYNLLMALGSTVAHNVRVKSLEDARDPLSNFKTTHSAWAPVQIAFSCAGLIFVFFGEEIVDIISNGKLTEAGSYIPALVIIALIQITEQPAAAIVYASGRAASATWFRTIMVFGSLVVLYPLIVLFGIKGILAVGIIEAAAYRAYLRILASRERNVPFQDGLGYFGCLAIIAAMAYVHLAMPSLGIELASMVAGIVIIALVGRRSIGEMITAVRQIIVPWRIPYESELTSFAHAADRARAKWSSRRTWRRRLLQILWLWREKGARYALKRALLRLGHVTRYYENWIRANDALSPRDLAQIHARIKRLQRRPLISLVLLIERPSAAALQCVIDSVCTQLYENWELRIAGHRSNVPDVRALLDAYAGIDARIKVMADDARGMIAAGNAGLADATGDFVGFLGQADQLAPHALYMIVEEINSCVDASLIYTDEDRIDDQGRRFSPHFKTDWNPDLFLSQNYIGHLTVYRRNLIAPPGLRAEFEGCEDYDLALRVIEQVAPATIRHVPYVLVHRKLPTVETAMEPSVALSARRALQGHLDRLGIRATVEASHSGNYHRVRRMLPVVPPRVSIIIPTRDRVEFLRGAIESILKQTNYPNYEIVIIDNQSSDSGTLSYLAHLAEHPQIRVLRFDRAFNYSAINNFAAEQCQSPVLAFLNNDLLVINGDWLTEMVSQAIRPEVGAVGAILYYPDDIIQHAGIIIGFGGVAVNCYNGLNRGSTGYCCRAELMQNYSAVTAACLLTRAEVFAEVGGFDESNLPVAFNDVDYCLRLRERGYLVTWTPYAELYHLESVSRGDDMSPSKIDRFRRDQAYMVERWAHVLSNDPYYSPNLSLDEMPFALAASPRLRRPWRSDAQSAD